MKTYNVGIIGGTGMVGQRFITLLQNHKWFKIKKIAASAKSSGKTYKEAVEKRWRMDEEIPDDIAQMVILDANDAKNVVKDLDFIFCAVDMKKEDIMELEEKYAKLECPVISNNSAHRLTPDVPMIIPEINSAHTKIIPFQKSRLGTKKGFIAVKSNCSLQNYVPVINSFYNLGVKNILACTYQSISGAGKTFNSWPEMVDNIIPFIGGEEEKSENEPLKIWGKVTDGKIINNNNISITTQCVRVPVSNGHMSAVFVSFKNKYDDIDNIIKMVKNYKVDSKIANLPSAPKKFLHYFEEPDMPQLKLHRNLEKGMSVSVGRMRKDTQYDVKFICMSHNTIRGAAGGAILLAELLCDKGYI